MKIYTTGEKSARQASYQVHICPGRHLEGQELASEFVNHKNEPVEITVDFKFGVAEVSDAVGKYMLKHGFAAKSKLIIRDPLVVA